MDIINDTELSTKELFNQTKESYDTVASLQSSLQTAQTLHNSKVVELKREIITHFKEGLRDNYNALHALDNRCLWLYADEPEEPFVEMLVNTIFKVLFKGQTQAEIELTPEAAEMFNNADFPKISEALDLGVNVYFATEENSFSCIVEKK